MQKNVLNVSENFRKMAVKSVLSIILFLFTYLILVIMGIGVIFLCGFVAYYIVTFSASFITGMIALGCIGMGFLIFFFLIKFIFSSSKKVDRSHLVEINEQQQPELFKMLGVIVSEVKTTFPKKVYLSSDVNASVFYDSNFWSMFFPVRKNLQIGLGLMNTVSVIELKAILAHEFGHFSQRSMKVGSYVYNVNKVIYNMLYDNEDYGSLLNGWSNISNYFALFAKGAIMVIQGIQYVLTKVYTVLNLNYMALSREMEFHADAVAASVAGSHPLANSLLRLGLADQSLNIVFNYYDSKITESQKPVDVYPQQYFVLNQMASLEELPIQDGLPVLSIDNYKKFNKTKLVLEDQWSSHPSTEQRVAKLMELNQPIRNANNGIAIDLLTGKEAIQELITNQLLVNVKYGAEPPAMVGIAEFINEYVKIEQENSYPAIFKRYFDERDPYNNFTEEDFEARISDQDLTFEELINQASTADINSLNTATNDKNILEKIYNGALEIDTFDYDGVKYSTTDAYPLITFLEAEIVRYNDILDKRDVNLFRFFLNKAIEQNNLEDFKTHSLSYQLSAKHLQTKRDVYSNLADAIYFFQTTTPFDQIIENMVQVKKMEKPFCEQIKLLLDDPFYQEHIDEEMRTIFEEYISKDLRYYGHEEYLNEEIEILYTVMNSSYSRASMGKEAFYGVHWLLNIVLTYFILYYDIAF
ncbi:MAG: M48 family metalloprotease [Candidatus Pedobacter colombiensis]|uniref:M48 family metalloprotease n=1 Tax=Candidatus Pedobacter colombiensis TaxID=3121371 RepID=A0AAJ5WBL2_9SPHI|nr:M48 family metallopeptidase [Pedobacter sp.]WEK21028.1 MAG: M48 family metalloprotease [Pedobacter sp.]